MPESLRLLSVTADALQEWKLVEAPPAEGKKALAEGAQLLRLTFDFAVTERVLVSLVGEMELRPPRAAAKEESKKKKDGVAAATTTSRDGRDAPADGTPMPLLRSIGTHREKGFLAVEASNNVEVGQEGTSGSLQTVDPAELPKEMKERVRAPLLSYKYLSPCGLHLSLKLTKHTDTEVLVTAIDEGHVETTVAQEGKVLHRCRLRCRNTQRQFLRAALPVGATIWSTLVDGVCIKPCIDEGGHVMLALKKSGATHKDQEFVVEFVYLTELQAPMHGRGKLQLSFPSFDVPVNHLFVTVRVPNDFKYGEFTGELKEVKRFSHRPNTDDKRRGSPGDNRNFCSAPNYNHRRPDNVVHSLGHGRSLERADSFTRNGGMWNAEHYVDGDEDVDHTEVGFSEFGDGAGIGAGPKKAGVTPVRVDLPAVGKPFYFEKLFVVGDAGSIAVRYKERPKGCWARRSVW